MQELERLTAIIRSTCPGGMSLPADGGSSGGGAQQHPLVPMFQGLWPILQAVGSRYSASATVAENVCRVYKHALRTGG